MRAAILVLSLSGAAAWGQEGDIRNVHDPCAIKSGPTYTVFSTGETIFIRQSKDLYHWTFVGKVFSALPAWAQAMNPRDNNIWAPDISYFSGSYHLYYAVSSFGTNHSAIGLATNSTLDPAASGYRWLDRGKVIESRPGIDDWNAIDPNLVLDGQGVPWLAFGSYWSGIKLRRIDPATGLLSSADSTLYSLAARPGSTAIEAAFIIRSHGYYYLLVAFDQCCQGAQSTYRTLVGRSSRVTGPYLDRSGNPMSQGAATLLLKGYDRFRGPGGASVLTDGAGQWLVHHYYDADENGIPKLQIRPLVWSDDLWPLAGEPLAGPPAPSTAEPVAGLWAHSVDFGAPGQIFLEPGGTINAEAGPDTWTLQSPSLTLRWPRADAPGGAWIDSCVLSGDGAWYVGRNQLDTIVRGLKVENIFIRGDANRDGVLDLSDVIYSLFYLVGSRGSAPCLKALDANDDGKVDLSDPIFTLNFLFRSGQFIPQPFPSAGLDPTADALGC
jgi:arabinan endo-1,5-alpha-L-arabinosidase